MKLWKIRRTDRFGYDDYDAIVVAAETEEEALQIQPDGSCPEPEDEFFYPWSISLSIEYLGEAKPELPSGLILSSFNEE
jgi:hypothetical protein